MVSMFAPFVEHKTAFSTCHVRRNHNGQVVSPRLREKATKQNPYFSFVPVFFSMHLTAVSSRSIRDQ
jgi:hypothetical protein